MGANPAGTKYTHLTTANNHPSASSAHNNATKSTEAAALRNFQVQQMLLQLEPPVHQYNQQQVQQAQQKQQMQNSLLQMPQLQVTQQQRQQGAPQSDDDNSMSRGFGLSPEVGPEITGTHGNLPELPVTQSLTSNHSTVDIESDGFVNTGPQPESPATLLNNDDSPTD